MYAIVIPIDITCWRKIVLYFISFIGAKILRVIHNALFSDVHVLYIYHMLKMLELVYIIA